MFIDPQTRKAKYVQHSDGSTFALATLRRKLTKHGLMAFKDVRDNWEVVKKRVHESWCAACYLYTQVETIEAMKLGWLPRNQMEWHTLVAISGMTMEVFDSYHPDFLLLWIITRSNHSESYRSSMKRKWICKHFAHEQFELFKMRRK